MAVQLNRRSGTMDTQLLISAATEPFKVWEATFNFTNNTFFSAQPVPAVAKRHILWIEHKSAQPPTSGTPTVGSYFWTVGGTSYDWRIPINQIAFGGGGYPDIGADHVMIWTSPEWKNKPLSRTDDIMFQQRVGTNQANRMFRRNTAKIKIGYF